MFVCETTKLDRIATSSPPPKTRPDGADITGYLEYSEFFIILKDIPIYNGEYTPIGKVILGLDALKKIKKGNKSNYVLRPDYIKSLKLID